MNVETGQMYRGVDEINAAKERGEPIVEVSERVAKAVEIGMQALNRRERREQAAKDRSKRAAGGNKRRKV